METVKYETGFIERHQAALEAVKLLEEAGFGVGDVSIDTEPQEMTFNLDVELSITEHERPLEVLE